MERIYQRLLEHLPGCGPANVVIHHYATDNPKFWIQTSDQRILQERSKIYDYRFNNDGFRCDDFDIHTEFPIVFLGCSMTCGVALELEKTWPFILVNKIKAHLNKKIPLWNLATAGSSVDKQALLLEKYISLLRPKLIFFLIPSMYRRFLAVNNEFVDYLPMHRVNQWRPTEETRKVGKFDSAFTQEDFAIFETYKNLLLINRLALSEGSTVYWDSWSEEPDKKILTIGCEQFSTFQFLNIRYVSGPSARDGSHPGIETNEMFAEHIFRKIKQDL